MNEAVCGTEWHGKAFFFLTTVGRIGWRMVMFFHKNVRVKDKFS